MNLPSFEEYKSQALAEGFDEVIERAWEANSLQPTHTHPFSVKALVVEGEMWLTRNGETLHLLPGGSFKMDQNVPHEELYGPVGAVYWAARKNHA